MVSIKLQYYKWQIEGSIYQEITSLLLFKVTDWTSLFRAEDVACSKYWLNVQSIVVYLYEADGMKHNVWLEF